MKKNFGRTIMRKVAYSIAVTEANSICTFLFYQPILPTKVKKLRKF